MSPFSFLPEYKTVDTLLQQMFESEIAPEGKDPSLKEILNFSPKKVNFDNSARSRAWNCARPETKISYRHCSRFLPRGYFLSPGSHLCFDKTVNRPAHPELPALCGHA